MANDGVEPAVESVVESGVAVLADVASPSSGPGYAVLRAYMTDVASRYYRRPVSPGEVDGYLADDPSDDLAPPTGLLVLARRNGTTVGCAGLRLLPDGIGEVKRVFVVPAERGHGIARLLLADLERRARELGLRLLRLDTRADLVEALTLYSSVGFERVPAFSTGPFAEVWLAKPLAPPRPPPTLPLIMQSALIMQPALIMRRPGRRRARPSPRR